MLFFIYSSHPNEKEEKVLVKPFFSDCLPSPDSTAGCEGRLGGQVVPSIKEKHPALMLRVPPR